MEYNISLHFNPKSLNSSARLPLRQLHIINTYYSSFVSRSHRLLWLSNFPVKTITIILFFNKFKNIHLRTRIIWCVRIRDMSTKRDWITAVRNYYNITIKRRITIYRIVIINIYMQYIGTYRHTHMCSLYLVTHTHVKIPLFM